jgi:hypothetical protein
VPATVNRELEGLYFIPVELAFRVIAPLLAVANVGK